MRRSPILHPFLFGLYPVLVLYQHNMQHVRFGQVGWPLAAAEAAVLAALAIAWLVVRNWRTAALIASAFAVFVFSYGHLADLLLHRQPQETIAGVDPLLALVWVGAFVAAAVILADFRGELRAPTNALNLLAGGLVVMALVGIVPYELHRPRPERLHRPPLPQLATAQAQPDIYYIILDRYGGERELKEFLGYDNRDFLSFLKEKGFYVAEKSHTNYTHTFQSLASSLNFSYLDTIVERMGPEATDETPIYELLQRNAVQRLLRARGYRYLHMGAWWEPTRASPEADANFVCPGPRFTEFAATFAGTTLFRPLFGWRGVSEPGRYQQRSLPYQFRELEKMPGRPGPKFVFAHILGPHPPYVFDAKGRPLREGMVGEGERLYAGQLTYTNTRMKAVVERLLADSKTPPIIILQADEGPKMPLFGGSAAEGGLTPTQVLHLGILNAYYLPGGKTAKLYPSISPVNTFRVVFDEYFGANYPLLPDRSWLTGDERYPYRMKEVTAALR